MAAALSSASCQKNDLLKPGSVESNVLVAHYVSARDFARLDSLNLFSIDGKAVQAEWGGTYDADRPYTQIRMTAENGSGDPGAPIYVSAKAFYTDTDLFLLLQWPDPNPDEMKDALVYVGPDLVGRRGGGELLADPANWARAGDEDRLALAFEMDPSGNGQGTYREQGCRIACHQGQNPVFGAPAFGRLDIWEWMACRTNQTRNLYIQTDDPNFPKYGIPGYLEDLTADPVTALTPDPGTPTWIPNWSGDSNRPLYVYRPLDDRFFKPADPNSCRNRFNEKCRANNGLPYYYIWREDIAALVQRFSPQDTMNYAVLPQGQGERKWNYLDAVTGYYYTYPSGSRADVRGKALYSEGFWTLEIGRKLNTGDPVYDRVFSLQENPGGAGADSMSIPDVCFTVAVADNSPDTHWGSTTQILRFGSRIQAAARQGGR